MLVSYSLVSLLILQLLQVRQLCGQGVDQHVEPHPSSQQPTNERLHESPPEPCLLRGWWHGGEAVEVGHSTCHQQVSTLILRWT